VIASIDDHIANVERDAGSLHGHYLSILSCTKELDKHLFESAGNNSTSSTTTTTSSEALGAAAGEGPRAADVASLMQLTLSKLRDSAVPSSPRDPRHVSLDLSRTAVAPESMPRGNSPRRVSVDLGAGSSMPEVFLKATPESKCLSNWTGAKRATLPSKMGPSITNLAQVQRSQSFTETAPTVRKQ